MNVSFSASTADPALAAAIMRLDDFSSRLDKKFAAHPEISHGEFNALQLIICDAPPGTIRAMPIRRGKALTVLSFKVGLPRGLSLRQEDDPQLVDSITQAAANAVLLVDFPKAIRETFLVLLEEARAAGRSHSNEAGPSPEQNIASYLAGRGPAK